MDKNWDQLIENYYGQRKTLNLSTLERLVTEVMDATNALSLIEEAASPQGKKAVRFDWTAIPVMPVNELGWASLSSNDKIAQGNRQQLEQFIGQLPGADLRTKLQRLSKMLNDPKYAMRLASFGDTRSSQIASTLQYLIFFKTLTTVITNFNAASAGFNFEAFLAVMLGGEQIPAAGADTIADITVKGEPISLKLYQEKTLKAGGSYKDLIGDLIRRKGYMQYVVVAKTLTGEGTQRSGKIDFYRYNLTTDNILTVLYNSADHHNDNLIRLPKAVIEKQRGRGLSFKIPEAPSFAETKQKFEDGVRNAFQNESYAEEIVAFIDYGPDRDNAFAKPPKAGLGQLKGRGKFIYPLLDGVIEILKNNGVATDRSQVWEILNTVNNEARAEALAAREKIAKIRGKGSEYASARESLEFFNGLRTAEKKRALMYTYGYQQGGLQYELRKADIYNIARLAGDYKVFPSGQNEVAIGQLEIGQEKIQEVLNTMVSSINESVFEIFENVKSMSDSLQTYFANAMEDNSLAKKAIESSQNIQVKTKEVAEIE